MLLISQRCLCGKYIKYDNVIAFYRFVQFFSFFFFFTTKLKKSQIIIHRRSRTKIRLDLYICINSYISSLLIRTSKRKTLSILSKNYSKLSRERRKIARAIKEECRAIEGKKFSWLRYCAGWLMKGWPFPLACGWFASYSTDPSFNSKDKSLSIKVCGIALDKFSSIFDTMLILIW